MSKKERDIWDDAIRSKLEDFEMDTLPGDWEAIADRLPGKAPVPLRRTLRYWVAAAVISLLVVSGGIYLYDREMEDLPIAQEIQSSQESTSVDIPVVPATGEIPEGSVAQAQQAFENLSNLLEAAGTGMDKVVKTTVFIKEMNDFAAINEVYAKFFPSPFPSRSCVEVARLPKDVMLEIEAIAVK